MGPVMRCRSYFPLCRCFCCFWRCSDVCYRSLASYHGLVHSKGFQVTVKLHFGKTIKVLGFVLTVLLRWHSARVLKMSSWGGIRYVSDAATSIICERLLDGAVRHLVVDHLGRYVFQELRTWCLLSVLDEVSRYRQTQVDTYNVMLCNVDHNDMLSHMHWTCNELRVESMRVNLRMEKSSIPLFPFFFFLYYCLFIIYALFSFLHLFYFVVLFSLS